MGPSRRTTRTTGEKSRCALFGPTQVPRARSPRPAISPSGTLSAMAPYESDSAGVWLLLPHTDGQADIGGGPAVLRAATTEGSGP